ncbi:FACT complex subunit spt16 [Conglomerata obtusa]
MSEVKLNENQFFSRIKKLQELFPNPLLILIGKTEDVKTVGSNSALFLYLLSYEFPETAIIIRANEVIFITSTKKAKILQQLSNIRIITKDNHFEIEKQLSNGTFSVCDSQATKGDFCTEIYKYINPIDVTNEINVFFTNKDVQSIEHIKQGYKASNFVMQKGVKLVHRYLSEENTVTHKNLGNKIENYLDEIDFLNANNLDLIYTPVVQSKVYDLENFENDNELMYKNVLVRVGLRYNGYCSEIGRMILVNPDSEILEVYEKLFTLREKIYEMFDEKIQNREEINLERINENINNHALDVNLEITTPAVFSSGLLQNEGIELARSDMYAFCIDLRSEINSILINLCDSFYIKGNKLHLMNEADDIKPYIIYKKMVPKKDTRSKEKEIEKNILRTEHQKELMDNIIEEMLEYYKQGNYKSIAEAKEEKVFIPYQKENLLPRHKSLFVDKKNFAVLIPFKNYVIPFSITSIKNVSKTEDGILRINFNLVGGDDSIKSITYKSSNDNIEELFLNISELKKDFNLKKDMLNTEETQKLIISGKKFVLPEVFVKTDVKARKGKANSLEMHENGFRYNYEGQQIEILFDNIKHMFFYEGTIEHRVLIHFNLHQPVFIPKKSYNIQFYKESGTNTVQDTSKIKDEYYEAIVEKEEENKRKEINREFNLFVDKIENNSSLRVQVPTRTGAFYGVPYKGSVYIQPTNECLVNLIEAPFFVLTLNEVEIVCFERVIYGVKTCDMTFIFKNKELSVMNIQCVESMQLPKIKEFLDDKNICFIESKVNIQWNAFIKVIMEDPVQFYTNGGWCELQPQREQGEESSTDEETSESSSDDDSVNTSDEDKTTDDEEEESFESSESIAESEIDESDEEDDEYDESEESDRPKKRRK